MEKQDEVSLDVGEYYLTVRARGERRQLSEMIEGIKRVVAASEAHNCPYILLDYRGIKYHVGSTQIFDLVRVFDINLPLLKNIVMCGVTSPSDLEKARFFESICQRRGYNFRLFEDINEAAAWLKEEAITTTNR